MVFLARRVLRMTLEGPEETKEKKLDKPPPLGLIIISIESIEPRE
jgi:hypothetical protein